jgi:hypothetical protein
MSSHKDTQAQALANMVKHGANEAASKMSYEQNVHVMVLLTFFCYYGG